MDEVKQIGSEMIAVSDIVEALDVTAHQAITPETRTCITFGVEFLEDHLRRLYGLEEDKGLLQILIHLHPELTAKVQKLHVEHDRVRADAHRLVMEMENPRDLSESELRHILRELRQLLREILHHEEHETEVLLDSVDIDRGGEG